jgi:hypothetical protein
MSAENRSEINNPLSPVNSGSGPQYNFLATQSSFQRRMLPGVWSEEYFHWMRRWFVAPPGFPEAADALEAKKTIFLQGKAGDGRRTAAIMLLDPTQRAGTRFRELVVDEQSPLDGDLLEPGDRLLLDLSSVGEEDYEPVLRGLIPASGVVSTRDARLVVVLNDRLKLSPDLRLFRQEIGRPNAVQALALHLRVAQIDPNPTDITQEIRDCLSEEPLYQVGNLTDLVSAARARHRAATPRSWLDQAFKAWRQPVAPVLTDFKRLRSAPQRALLLSAAMFSGGLADAAFHGANMLLRAVKFTTDEQHLMERADLTERLEEFHAEIDPQRRIHFTELAYDATARAYFWDGFPDLRRELAGWAETIVTSSLFGEDDRVLLVSRFAEQSLRANQLGTLARLAARWAERPDSVKRPVLVKCAEVLITAGLRDERHSGWFRQLIYSWSQRPGLGDALAALVLRVCIGELAETYPEQAVTRLRHLSRHSSAAGTDAINALLRLTRGDNHLLRVLLYRIAGATVPSRADCELFLGVADPRRLTDRAVRTRSLLDESNVRRDLIAGWHTVMRDPEYRRWAVRVHSWLQAYADDPYAENLLNVLVEAASADFSALSRLCLVARAWASSDSDQRAVRRPVAALLLRKIDLAQGIDFTEVTPEEATR